MNEPNGWILMTKDGEIKPVHPGNVGNHVRAGWKRAEEALPLPAVEALSEPEAVELSEPEPVEVPSSDPIEVAPAEPTPPTSGKKSSRWPKKGG